MNIDNNTSTVNKLKQDIKNIFEMDNNLCKECGCNMELFEGEYVCSNCGHIKKYNTTYKF